MVIMFYKSWELMHKISKFMVYWLQRLTSLGNVKYIAQFFTNLLFIRKIENKN